MDYKEKTQKELINLLFRIDGQVFVIRPPINKCYDYVRISKLTRLDQGSDWVIKDVLVNLFETKHWEIVDCDQLTDKERILTYIRLEIGLTIK